MFVLLLLLGTTAVADMPAVEVRHVQGKEKDFFVVTGLDRATLDRLARLSPADEQWGKVFAVRVEQPGADLPAMLGTYRIAKEKIFFEPRFPLTPGVTYKATCQPSLGKAVETKVKLPRVERKATTVVRQVYPTADRLPENQLKFYLHFSAPMSKGEAYSHIQLLDATGKAVDLPFLELDQELWDSTGTRFTLFFDPGRIKRGLKPREDHGPALEEGKSYTLLIDRTWKDAEGTPLRETFRKRFSVSAPDDTQPDQTKWKLKPSKEGTRAPLRVDLGKSMDHGLLQRMLWVVDGSGKRVAGKIEISDRERIWEFIPDVAWSSGRHALVADTRIEDLAGNSIGRPFEVDIVRPTERRVKQELVQVPFEITR